MLHDDLLRQAFHLLDLRDAESLEANRRRAISSAYYSVFHAIGFQVAQEMLGTSDADYAVRALVRRSLKHTEMRDALQGFASGNLRPLYRQITGDRKNEDLRILATKFVSLQSDRHKADYDVTWEVTELIAQSAVFDAELAIAALTRLADNAEAYQFQKLFMVSVLFHNALKGRS